MKLYLILTLSLTSFYGIKIAIDNYFTIESNGACLEVYKRSMVVDGYLEDLVGQVDNMPKYR